MANNSPPNPATADSSSAAANSPKAKAAARAATSPWKQAVRGGESEPIVSSAAAPAMPSATGVNPSFSPDRSPTKAVAAVAASSSSSLASSDGSDGGDGNGNAGKKPVWNKPSNGAVEAGSVIDAGYWPALSESAKGSSTKPSSLSDSLKALPEGLVSSPQGTGMASSSSLQRQGGTGSSNPTLPANNAVVPNRQKSARRGGGAGGGGSSAANGRFPQANPNPAIGPVVESTSNSSTARSGPVVQDSSPRDRVGSQSHSGSDQSQQRGSFRRGNGNSHPRGEGSYHQNYGNRRDQDRGSHEWNSSHQNFNGRDGNLQTPRASTRGGMRPSPRGSNSFIPPQPMPLRPLVNPMVYPEMVPPFIFFPGPHDFRGVPFVGPMPPRAPAFIFPPPDLQLHASIVKQIEYYFSNDNLVKDIYLRQNMDDQGWVPIKLIAGFRRVKDLTDNVKLIMDAVCASSVVEVQGEKLRKRGDWSKWVMPSPAQFPSSVSSPRSFGGSTTTREDNLVASFEGVSLAAERTNHQQQGQGGDVVSIRSPPSVDLNSSSKDHPSGGERLLLG